MEIGSMFQNELTTNVTNKINTVKIKFIITSSQVIE